MERTDNDLVREARRGDKEAFRALVERYQRKITSVALGMVRNPDDAMDIAQDTFIKAYRNLDGFKGESSFYTWLYRIVVNRAIDVQRRDRRQPVVAVEDRFASDDGSDPYERIYVESQQSDPHEETQSRQIGARVKQAIDELTPDHKAVILLREVEGLSYEEISDIMQCSLGTVMSRLHYARKKLQRKLKDCF